MDLIAYIAGGALMVALLVAIELGPPRGGYPGGPQTGTGIRRPTSSGEPPKERP